MKVFEIRSGYTFNLKGGNRAQVSQVHALGVHYHTIDEGGKCIASEKYVLKSELNKLRLNNNIKGKE